jgi:hypothetical protein
VRVSRDRTPAEAPADLASIEWQAPWLCALSDVGRQVDSTWRSGGPLAAALNARRGVGMPSFVPQACLPPDEAYEAFIHRTGTVPTRDNLHDFFNGLVWLRFPRTKRRLNEWQAAEIARHGVGATRGPLRDALTLLDENGAVLDAPPALWRSLLARDWRRLFVTERELWREARLLVFGHALLEKLVAPRKALTAHVLVTATPSAHGSRPDLTGDDGALAEALDAALGLASRALPALAATKPFAPLPVLGIPLWWPGNSDFRFYDDPDVFRPARPPRP